MRDEQLKPIGFFEQVKQHTLEAVVKGDPRFSYIPRHLIQVQRWADELTITHPEADREVLDLAVNLHDIGQVVGDNEDHAVNSEAETRRYLTESGLPAEKVDRVAHCVRSHRCRDVQPETIEAKILAAADSASHMTDYGFIDMLNKGTSKVDVLAKLERDRRDVSVFPELKDKIDPLCEAWKKLIETYPTN